MARVVQRPSSPPYLLFIMIFLFVISTALAVMWKMQADEAREKADDLDGKIKYLATREETKSGLFQELKKEYDKAPRSDRQTVFDALSTRINNLTDKITGSETSYGMAIKAADDSYGDKGVRGLVNIIDLLRKDSEDSKTVAQAATDQITVMKLELETEIAKTEASVAKRKAALAVEREKYNALSKKFDAEQEAHKALRTEALKTTDQRITESEKRIQVLGITIQDKELKIQVLLAKNAEQLEIIKKLKRELGGNVKGGAPLSVAKLMEDPSADGICYISVGKKESVNPGDTFPIYHSGILTTETPTKGSLTVTRVHDDVSECRITSIKKDETITKGDQVANFIRNPGRTFLFVVEGEFDLQGTDRPSPEGAEKINMLITRYGGKLAKEVSIKTDYLILGDEMAMPNKPGDDASSQIIAIYKKRMEIYRRYVHVQASAMKLGIPIYNTNRFLDRIGFVPTKTRSFD